MNKQFLSVLLLTCFATSAYPTGFVTAMAKEMGYVFTGLGFGVAGLTTAGKQYAANVAAEKAAATVVSQESIKAAIGNGIAADYGIGAEKAAYQSGLASVAKSFGCKVPSEYVIEQTIAKAQKESQWSQLPFADRAKYYAGALKNATVAGAKSAYNATGSAATATGQWVKNHPGYTTAIVAGVAAAGYLAYTYWPSKSEVVALSAQDQQTRGLARINVKRNLVELMRQTPGQGFYKDGDFNVLALREFFTGTPASYGVSKDTVRFLNDAVTCAHALNYIRINNVKVEDSVTAKIQARLEQANSKIAAALAA